MRIKRSGLRGGGGGGGGGLKLFFLGGGGVGGGGWGGGGGVFKTFLSLGRRVYLSRKEL